MNFDDAVKHSRIIIALTNVEHIWVQLSRRGGPMAQRGTFLMSFSLGTSNLPHFSCCWIVDLA